MTFRGPAEKCEFEPFFYENFVFAVQRDPRIAPNFDVFSEGRSGGSVLRSETPKMPTEADFGGFWADSGARSGRFSVLFGVRIPIGFSIGFSALIFGGWRALFGP